ncbi:hypothetical protein MBLNU13_g10872t1 [Cladosporium sp. NU13]
MSSQVRAPRHSARLPSSDQEPGIEMKQSNVDAALSTRPHPEGSHTELLKALVPAAFMLVIVFWINAAHLYGLFHHQDAYTHRARVALADFDGGAFGEALRLSAVTNNASYGYPTFVNIDTTASSMNLVRREVFKGTYWAAIVVHPGATDRFKNAVNGTTTDYDSNDVYSYVVLDARYYTLYASSILSTTVSTASTASGIFSAKFIADLLPHGEFANTTAAISALTGPAHAVEIPAASRLFAVLDDKAFINTVGTVLPILMQFFFIMAWNGICNSMHLYAGYDLRTHILARLFWSTIWPICTSLCVVGWTLAFRGSYPIDVKMFFAFWAVTWVFCMINFDVLDIVIGFIPMAFVTFFVLTWVIFNVVASLGPEEMLNHWYRVNYLFPSLHWYQTTITILTKGGNSKLYYTLPVLVAWLVSMKCLSPLATKSRIMKAQGIFEWYNERNALGGPH